ncbi:MAG: hypothetical protein ABIS36_10990, partial [Chryseolinea sp.]
VLDQNMPRMNGKQTLSFMKSHEIFSRIPAVIYSTYTDRNLIMGCTQLGAIDGGYEAHRQGGIPENDGRFS